MQRTRGSLSFSPIPDSGFFYFIMARRLARLAAAKASPEIVAKLGAILRRVAASEGEDAIEKNDGAFHRLIAETAGNRLLLMTFDVIDRIRLTRSWRGPRSLARNVDRLRVTN